jgi:hypothetical protein
MDRQVTDHRHRNQVTADNQPIRQTNSFGSKPAVRFDGTNDFLNISSLSEQLTEPTLPTPPFAGQTKAGITVAT